MGRKYAPRNDYVLIRRVVHGQTPSGIAVGDDTLEGIDHVVEAYGPAVKGLKEGDKVLIVGVINEHYGFLPNTKDMILTKEANIGLIYRD